MTLECLVLRTYHTQSVLSAAQTFFSHTKHLGKKSIVLVDRLLPVQKADSVICHSKPVQMVVKQHTPKQKVSKGSQSVEDLKHSKLPHIELRLVVRQHLPLLSHTLAAQDCPVMIRIAQL